MRWTPGGYGDEIEDRRGEGGGGGGFGGRGIGLGGLLVLGLLSLFFGRDFITPFLGGGGSAAVSPARRAEPNPARKAREERSAELVAFTMKDLQNTWTELLPKETGEPYQRTKAVFFWDTTDSACGYAESASGPFYCPGDGKVFIDLGFYDELRRRFGAPGEFAQAYVIAHEVGHHVQNLLGIESKVRRAQSRNPRAANALSVRLELQADCLAGVWGHSAAQRGIIDTKDVEEGLHAAAAIGDDRIQQMAAGHVFPDKFTHGSSAQRVEWFRRGLESGSVRACNTFE